ncbi:MAG: hypothetical protein II735_03435 [Clostridia bacterium]|nr:hypothetical protein [Clostridia bacterium]
MEELAVNKKEFQEAYELNQRIIAAAQMAQKSLYEMCVLLKQMRDSKKYKVLGYDNFEEYCEEEAGFSSRNARNYISIIENISEEKRKTFSAFGMGKLSLLASLSESQQEEIQQKVDLEDVSVRELKAEIARLKEEKQKADKAAADANQQRIAMQSDLLSAKSKNRSLSHELEDARKMSGDAKGLAARLKDAERELSIADQDNYNKLEAQRIEYQKKINALQKQLDDAGKMREVAVETVPDYEAVFRAYYHAAVMAIKEMMTFLQSLDKGTSYQGKCFDLADDLADAMSDALYDKKTGIEKIYAEEGIL